MDVHDVDLLEAAKVSKVDVLKKKKKKDMQDSQLSHVTLAYRGCRKIFDKEAVPAPLSRVWSRAVLTTHRPGS